MKKMKKFLTMLLAGVMAMGMSVTAFADETPQPTPQPTLSNTESPLVGAYPTDADTTTIKIAGITNDVNVTLYKIAEAKYYTGATQKGFEKYVYAEGIVTEGEAGENQYAFTPENPTANQIADITNGLINGNIVSYSLLIGAPVMTPALAEGADPASATWSKVVNAGVYIAVITGGADASIYNPVLLTATYNAAGKLEGGAIDVTAKALYGDSAVAKKTTPSVDKTVTGTENETVGDETKKTASVGDELTYKISPVAPSYPDKAANKTFYLSDMMDKGLTFDFGSLTVELVTKTGETETSSGIQITKTFLREDGKTETTDPAEYVYVVFKKPGASEGTFIEIARAKYVTDSTSEKTGFNLSFVYNELLIAKGNGAIYTPIVTYKAVINENAVIGETGNKNVAELYYSNQPNTGSDYDELDKKPENQEGVIDKPKSKEEIVYTYKLAFKKIDSEPEKDDNGDLKTDGDGKVIYPALANAVFGIYSSATPKTNDDGDPVYTDDGKPVYIVDENSLVDIVKTDASGYGVSAQVEKGDYYIKELYAPAGYSLNTEVYKITASWSTATKKVETWSVTTKYTSIAANSIDSVQVGWLKGNVFYEMNNFTAEEAGKENSGILPAYVANVTMDDNYKTTITQETNKVDGVSELSLKDGIPNTKLVNLPSTGGIGTTIFTIGGCAIMVIAAALFFATRRKSEK